MKNCSAEKVVWFEDIEKSDEFKQCHCKKYYFQCMINDIHMDYMVKIWEIFWIFQWFVYHGWNLRIGFITYINQSYWITISNLKIN